MPQAVFGGVPRESPLRIASGGGILAHGDGALAQVLDGSAESGPALRKTTEQAARPGCRWPQRWRSDDREPTNQVAAYPGVRHRRRISPSMG
jgi:hypothetical protein